MEDEALVADLAPVAVVLLERHLETARDWYPHEMVPWERAADGAEPAEPLAPGVQSALFVNVLTEDNLPYYTTALYRQLGDAEPWWDWTRRWTAEEMRHGTAMHDYLCVTQAVDLHDLERARMSHVMASEPPSKPAVPEAFVYLTLQELATRIAHGNTGRKLGDEAGRRLMSRIAADENLHHLFYRDLVSAGIERDPSRMVLAIEDQVRSFAMPGVAIPGFASHARAIAKEGIYSIAIFCEQVLVPTVLRQWRLAELTGLSAAAEAARERTLTFIARLGRIAERASGAGAAATAGAAAG